MGNAGRAGCPLRLCLGSTGLRAELYSNIGIGAAALPPIIQVLVFNGFYDALLCWQAIC